MKIDRRYAQKTDGTAIVFTEKGRTIRFSNPNHFTCYKVDVDGGVIADNDRAKCDKLLIVVEEGKQDIDDRDQEHYVELKGRNVAHALEQIEATIPDLWLKKDIAYRCSYVVCSKVSPKLTATIQKAKDKFATKYKSKLFVKEKLSPILKRV